ncbi:Ribosome biogenesis protein Kri1 [Coemansia sp. RSA 2336]|nr:Ribosome biogenesis protein Kri1 [Coemansia sp. RSA 2336]
MSSHSESDSSSSSSESTSVDLSKVDKRKLLRAKERRRRADDENGKLEDYLSSSSDSSDSSDSEDSESSSDEIEDENGELITPEVDAQIMKTLTALQSKDTSVYNPKVNFFSEEAVKKAEDAWKAKQAQKEKQEGMTLAQYQYNIDMEHGGVVDEEKELPRMTHVEEQKALKDAFKQAAQDIDEEEEDLLVKKEKSQEEIAREDAEYRKFLLENVTGDVDDQEAFKAWASTASEGDATKGDPNQAFLMNYILNRGWINKDVSQAADENDAKAIVDKEEDDEMIARMDDFESQFNFRFTEEGGTQIKTYPREIEGSLRRKDDRRKRARERAKERKAELKRQKAEELKRIKNQKKKGILEKLKEIQQITGNKTVGLDTLDLDGDYDPEKFQAQMDKLFDSEHCDIDDSVKPTWDDDINIDDILEQAEKDAQHDQANGDDFIMDADYVDGVDPNALSASKSGLKDKVSDYMDKYYQLGFEDIIGDNLPTRFKYTKVKPVDYGLSPADILLADDSMLNEYVSVKKMAAYRPEWKIDEDTTKHTNKKRAKYIKKKTQAIREEWEKAMSAPPKGKKRLQKSEGKSADTDAQSKKPNRRQRKKAKQSTDDQ